MCKLGLQHIACPNYPVDCAVVKRHCSRLNRIIFAKHFKKKERDRGYWRVIQGTDYVKQLLDFHEECDAVDTKNLMCDVEKIPERN